MPSSAMYCQMSSSVQLRQREHPDVLALAVPAVVEAPQLGPLVLRVPLPELVAEARTPAPWPGPSPRRGGRRRTRRRSRAPRWRRAAWRSAAGCGWRAGPVSSTTRPVSMASCTDADDQPHAELGRPGGRGTRCTSAKLWPVSMCITGNGSRAGQNAFSASRSMTIESLPPENSSTGRSNSAATSRMMWIDSASRARRWESSYGMAVDKVDHDRVGSSRKVASAAHALPARHDHDVAAGRGRRGPASCCSSCGPASATRPTTGGRCGTRATGRRTSFIVEALERAAARRQGALRGGHGRSARRLGADRVWIVDPLDGTREFGEPGRSDWAVHVALVDRRGHADRRRGGPAGRSASPCRTEPAPPLAAAARRPAADHREPQPPAGRRPARRRGARRRARRDGLRRRQGDGRRARRGRRLRPRRRPVRVWSSRCG